MKQKLILLIIAFFSSLFIGCTAVYTKTPLGERPAELVAEELNGTWINEEGALTVQVVDEVTGHLVVGWIDENEDGLKLVECTVEVWEQDDWLIANIKGDEKADHYVWILLKIEGRKIVIWSPNSDRFKQLIQAGKIEGTIKNKNVFLEGLLSEQLRMLISSSESGAINWDDPGMLFRLGN